MKFIIYTLMLLLLAIQGHEHPNQKEIKEKYKKCLRSEEFITDECQDLFNSFSRDAAVTQYKVKLYKRLVTKAANDYDKCRKSERTEDDCDLEKADREKIISQVKKELQPWVEMDEMCEPYRPDPFCDNMITYYHQPDNWGKKPEALIEGVKFAIAVQSHIMGEDTDFFKKKVKVIKFSSEEDGEL